VLYLSVLAACLLGTLPLEVVLGARVYRRWRRVVLTLVPVLGVFLLWDALSISAGFWSYHRLTGLRVGNLPVEEIAFFVVVPLCCLLTYEAVLTRRPHWTPTADRPAVTEPDGGYDDRPPAAP
jgi:lycopene cyclase domain-containing protein